MPGLQERERARRGDPALAGGCGTGNQQLARRPTWAAAGEGVVMGVKCAACQERGQTWNGSAPRCAFDGRPFSDNWNCATVNLIRDLVYEGQELPHGVDYQYCEDMKYATVKIDHIELPSGPAMALWVAWYKSRGSTDSIWLLDPEGPPRLPTEGDLVAVADAFTPKYRVTTRGRELLEQSKK